VQRGPSLGETDAKVLEDFSRRFHMFTNPKPKPLKTTLGMTNPVGTILVTGFTVSRMQLTDPLAIAVRRGAKGADEMEVRYAFTDGQ
jgi:hypothetical protein